ncbi:hypothetical protein [Deinococcus wulumuqiensis]|uniref:hypothetical protein n=1 Tax=Deinococcus wulumuqiensis TaxID=980427 RepID=UPI00242AA75B|nr:hypothetical protein [Deinococcus wulumuqiensis]
MSAQEEVPAAWEIVSTGGDTSCVTILSHAIQSIIVEGTSKPGEADVTLYAYPPEYGIKQLIPPPAPEQLFWPTAWGPNADGEVDGALLTPAMVPDVRAENGALHAVPVAASKFMLSPGDIKSSVAVGILPFKEGGST